MNSYSLQNLYNKGILDYIPTDLISVTPVSVMSPMQNPYLGLAQAGGLYQNSINGQDNFIQSINNQTNGSFNIGGYGGVSNISQFGENYNGATSMDRQDFYSQNGINNNIYSNNNLQTNNVGSSFFSKLGAKLKGNKINGINSQQNELYNGMGNNYGSYGIQNDYNNDMSYKHGIYNTATKINNTSSFVKGLASGAIILGTLIYCFKRGKKPQKVPIKETTNESFWSKLNIFKLKKNKNK